MSTPDPRSVVGPAPSGSAVGPPPGGPTYTVTLTAQKADAATKTQFLNELVTDNPIHVTCSITPVSAGSGDEYTFTFSSATGDVTLISSSCADGTVLDVGQSCGLTFAVTTGTTTIGRVKGGKSTTYRVITPPASIVRAA